MVRVLMVKGRLQRSGWLDIGNTDVEIFVPRRGRPAWVFPREDVTRVDPMAYQSRDGDPTPAAAIFPRVEVVRLRTDVQANTFLVFRRPRQVPSRRGKPRWADAVGVCLSADDLGELRSAGLRTSPSLNDALVSGYGTVESPSIGESEMQLGWHVSGDALSKPGPYSRDARPIARTAPGADQDQERRRLAIGILVGAAAAVVTSLAWAAVAYYTGTDAAIAAFAVGAAVGWAVRFKTRAARRQRALGIAAGVLAFAGIMLGWFILDLRYVADANNVDLITAFSVVQDIQGGWRTFLGRPFTSLWDWAFIGGGLYYAYSVGSSPRDGGAWRQASGGPRHGV
jgi:hypothetical protein